MVANLRILGLDQERIAKGAYSEKYKDVRLERGMFEQHNPLGLELVLYFLLTKLPEGNHKVAMEKLKKNFPVLQETSAYGLRLAAMEIIKSLPIDSTALQVKTALNKSSGDALVTLLLMVSRHVMLNVAGLPSSPFQSQFAPGPMRSRAALNALRLLVHRERHIFETRGHQVLRTQAMLGKIAEDIRALPGAPTPSPGTIAPATTATPAASRIPTASTAASCFSTPVAAPSLSSSAPSFSTAFTSSSSFSFSSSLAQTAVFGPSALLLPSNTQQSGKSKTAPTVTDTPFKSSHAANTRFQVQQCRHQLKVYQQVCQQAQTIALLVQDTGCAFSLGDNDGAKNVVTNNDSDVPGNLSAASLLKRAGVTQAYELPPGLVRDGSLDAVALVKYWNTYLEKFVGPAVQAVAQSGTHSELLAVLQQQSVRLRQVCTNIAQMKTKLHMQSLHCPAAPVNTPPGPGILSRKCLPMSIQDLIEEGTAEQL